MVAQHLWLDEPSAALNDIAHDVGSNKARGLRGLHSDNVLDNRHGCQEFVPIPRRAQYLQKNKVNLYAGNLLVMMLTFPSAQRL